MNKTLKAILIFLTSISALIILYNSFGNAYDRAIVKFSNNIIQSSINKNGGLNGKYVGYVLDKKHTITCYIKDNSFLNDTDGNKSLSYFNMNLRTHSYFMFALFLSFIAATPNLNYKRKLIYIGIGSTIIIAFSLFKIGIMTIDQINYMAVGNDPNKLKEIAEINSFFPYLTTKINEIVNVRAGIYVRLIFVVLLYLSLCFRKSNYNTLLAPLIRANSVKKHLKNRIATN